MTSQMRTQRLNHPATTMGVWGLVGVLLVAAVLAVFFGLIAVTTSPILVSMAAAMLVGVFLLAKPIWNIWFVLVLGLMVVGVVPIWADALGSKAVWGVSILGFALMGSALFSAASRPGAARNTPAFVWVALIFMLYAVVVTLIQFYSIGEFLTAYKRYFQAFGLMFALSWLAIDEQDIFRWRRFFVIVALMQLPFALYERISLVPQREGLHLLNLVPIDAVAGTFGASLYSGGANGEMAAFLIIVLAFMLARRQVKIFTTGRLVLMAPLVLAPLFLGETKAVVVMLPMMFIVLYRHELLVRPHHAVMGLLLGILLTFSALMAYLNITKMTLDEQIKGTLSYNVYEGGYGRLHLNRTTVLTFWAEQQGAHDPVSLVLGNGLGSSHRSTGGHIALQYPSYGIGLTAASTLLWELGIFGFALYLAILALAWRTAGRLRREASEALVRADSAAIQAVLPLFGFYLFYRLAMLETMTFQIVFAALLGYLAWLHRRHTCSSSASKP